MASATEAVAAERLSLYVRPLCGACMIVCRVIERLDLPVKIRNIRENRTWYDELVEARGRGTTPVLRIDHANGETTWLPESRDIVAWLNDRFVVSVNSGQGGR